MKTMNDLTLKTRRIKNKFIMCKGHVYRYIQMLIINTNFSQSDRTQN